MTIYQLPEIPLTPIDLINRRAAATGSMRYAQLSSGADYNGHHVCVAHKPHALSGPIWNAEYTWAGRIVLGRGSLDSCLRAAKSEYDRGAHGSLVVAYVDESARETKAEQIALFESYGLEPATQANHKPPYWTGTHQAVSNALSWERQGRFSGMIHHALQYTGSVDDWDAERTRWLNLRRKTG